jgi:hypothetical protein
MGVACKKIIGYNSTQACRFESCLVQQLEEPLHEADSHHYSAAEKIMVAGSSLTTETRVNLHEFEEIAMLWKVTLTDWENQKIKKSFWLRKNAIKFWDEAFKCSHFCHGVVKHYDDSEQGCQGYFQRWPREGGDA